MGPISKQRLTLVIPVLSTIIYALESQMSVPIGVTQGLRKSTEQLALWSQGRLDIGQVNSLRAAVGWAPLSQADNMKPVTDAKPGYSWHEFGMAVDVVPEDAISFQPDWNESHAVWQEIVQKGEALSLVSGKSWHDVPHFQLTGRFSVTPDDEVRGIYHSGGIQAVWSASGIKA